MWKRGVACVSEFGYAESALRQPEVLLKDWHLTQDADPYRTIARAMYAPHF